MPSIRALVNPKDIINTMAIAQLIGQGWLSYFMMAADIIYGEVVIIPNIIYAINVTIPFFTDKLESFGTSFNS